MKTLFFWVLGFTLLAVAFVALKPEPKPLSTRQLPWDITLTENGLSRVFGITLGQTTVAEALALLGEDHDLAIISDQQDKAGLEIYYSHFRSGPLAAKLVLTVDADPLLLETMQTRASAAEYLTTGARKFLLSPVDLAHAQTLPIASMTLIPSANLNRETIVTRFGEPAEVLSVDENTQHFLYPSKGLDVVFHQEAKETLQYLAPQQFETLLTPLRQKIAEQAKPQVQPVVDELATQASGNE